MGCTTSKSSPRGDRNEILASRKIEAALRREKKKKDSEIVLLLLGTGEAGKSTLLNQAKLIYLRNFTEEERLSYKELIHSNLIVSIRAVLLYGCKIHENENFFSFLQPENKVHAQKLLSDELLIEQVVTEELALSITALYSDEKVLQLLKLSHEYQLFDSAEYFFQEVERVAKSDYIPSEKDCLLSRHRTTGVNEVIFETDNVIFRMIDVGGQRNERKKWFHYFQDATVVLFCIAISEYNQSLYEDSQVNRLHESLKLFKELYHNPIFVDIPFIVFFNKRDIFKRKIKEHDMKVCFEDYDGGCDYDNAIEYLKNTVTELAKPLKKELYNYVTCAADTSQMRKIYNCVRDVIFRESFNDSVL